MSFLSLGSAVFATQTTFGWLFGWRPAVDGQNPANNAVVSPIKNSIPSTVLSHIYIYIACFHLGHSPKSPEKMSPYTTGEAPAQCRIFATGTSTETFWMCGRFRFPASRFWAKSFPKNKSTDLVSRALGSYFWILFSDLQLKGQKTVNPQRKIVVMEYHRIHLVFFEVFVRWVYMLHFATWFFLTNVVYAMAVRGRRLADPSLSLGMFEGRTCWSILHCAVLCCPTEAICWRFLKGSLKKGLVC